MTDDSSLPYGIHTNGSVAQKENPFCEGKVGLAKGAKKKTALSTGSRLWLLKVLPFGLCNFEDQQDTYNSNAWWRNGRKAIIELEQLLQDSSKNRKFGFITHEERKASQAN